MGDAQVLQVVRSSEAARQNMLNRRPFARSPVKTHRAATDQAATRPEVILPDKCGVRLGDARHQVGV
jgi:hypothetical protein